MPDRESGTPAGNVPHDNGRRDRPRLWKFTASSFVALFLVWLPYRMALAGNIEEWGLLGLFVEREPVFFAHASSLLAGQSLRPLTAFPHAVAFALHPDSFALWHVIQFTALVAAGMALGYVAAWALRSDWVGVIAAVLFVLYPADTMRLSFRSLHINVAMALALVAAALVLAAPRRQTRAGQAAMTVGAAISMLLACLMYEAVVPLVVLPVVAVIVRLGVRRGLRTAIRRRAIVGTWVAAPLAYVAYFVFSPRSTDTYQTAITSSPTGFGERLHTAVGDLATVALPRGLYIGWLDGLRIVWTEFVAVWYLVLGAAVIAVTCWWLSRGGHRSTAQGGPTLRLAIAGVVLVVLGFAPFLPSPSHVVIAQRTYVVAAVGGALVWLSVVVWLVRRFAPVGIALAGLLLVAGFGAHLYQFHRYVTISDEQRRLLAQVVERLPATETSAKPILIIDESRQIGQVWMFPYGDIRSPLVYLTARSFGDVDVCTADGFWATTRPVGQIGTCNLENGQWVFRSTVTPVAASVPPAGSIAKVLSPRDVTIVRVGDRAENGGHREAELRRQRTPLGRRYADVLSVPRGRGSWMFRDGAPRAGFRQDFGEWGFDIPVAGFGWQEQRREPNWWGARTSAWKTAERSTVRFDLVPTPGPYRVSGRVRLIASDAHRAGTRVEVNGSAVPLTWGADGTRFDGAIPSGVLRRWDNEMAVSTPVTADNAGYSAAVDWVEIEPAGTGGR